MSHLPFLFFSLAGVLLLVAIGVYGWFIEPAHISLTKHSIPVKHKGLNRAVRVLFLSDLHVGKLNSLIAAHHKMEQVLAEHFKEPVDFILIGGDFLDKDPSFLPNLFSLLGQLKSAKVPILAVLGNHDYKSYGDKPEKLISALEEEGVRVLRNEGEVLHLPGQDIVVVGLDELESSELYARGKGSFFANFRKRASNMKWYEQMDGLKPELPRILLVHNPDGVYLSGLHPILTLAGHTHGGQMAPIDWLSIFDPAFLLPSGSFRTWAGRKTIGERELIVGRGFDGSSIPVRLLRPPEATFITLIPEK